VPDHQDQRGGANAHQVTGLMQIKQQLGSIPIQ
jgi:hypothetical protein